MGSEVDTMAREGWEAPSGTVDLYWIPLGAGAHAVRLSGRLFEATARACSDDLGAIFTIQRWRLRSLKAALSLR
jgi:hypothetical protein